jgi:hypothetical protein
MRRAWSDFDKTVGMLVVKIKGLESMGPGAVTVLLGNPDRREADVTSGHGRAGFVRNL